MVIVDDDQSLLRGLGLALAAYQPATAQSATEALTLVQHCRPKLLITDYLMPNISGIELIAHARAHQPDINVILLTGHGAFLEHIPSLANVRRLEKPCGVQRLQEVVAALIGPPSMANARPEYTDDHRSAVAETAQLNQDAADVAAERIG